MTAAEARAAIQRARTDVAAVLDGAPFSCLDQRPVAGQSLTCMERGPGDPYHWTVTTPCAPCRVTYNLLRAAGGLLGAQNWAADQ